MPLTLAAPAMPHLKRRKLPVLRATSRPHEPPSVIVEPFSPLKASCRPTSRPMTYPAPNPTTDTKTTTPAETTQVRNVGEIIASSSIACILFFFNTRAFSPVGFVALAFRLPFSAASWLDIDGLLRARVDGLIGLEVFAAGIVGAINSDSGTNRSSRGSLLVMAVGAWFRLGRPRAAAAPMDRSVVREARRAAS